MIDIQASIPLSKSEWIRALLIQTYLPLCINTHHCSSPIPIDVKTTQTSLEQLSKKQLITIEGSATAFRFIALRASRIPGIHFIQVDSQLASRPHHELGHLFDQLNVRWKWNLKQDDSGLLEIHSNGWTVPVGGLNVDTSISSQFISGILINSLQWPNPIEIHFNSETFVSEPYFELTLQMLREAGVQWSRSSSSITLIPQNLLQPITITIQPDLSSAFVIAAWGVLWGRSHISVLPKISWQPDFRFLSILESMCGTHFQSTFVQSELHAIDLNIQDTPDIFPILSVLCAFAKGTSRIYGAKNLKFKESDRISKVSELLTLMKVDHRPLIDGIEITGRPRASFEFSPNDSVIFDPSDDHRIAMAASLFFPVFGPGNFKILHSECVQKSFPHYWSLIS